MAKNQSRLAKSLSQRIWEEKFQPGLRSFFYSEQFVNGPWFKPGFEFIENLCRLSNVPVVRDWLRNKLQLLDPARSNASWIPINKNIAGVEGIVLPIAILDRLIEHSQHRVILSYCPCRKAMKCKHYPVEIGCLMMGETALEIGAHMRRPVSIGEAKAYARKAIDLGFVPIIGKVRPDNDFLFLRDVSKLLTTCFCCECCCVSRYTRHVPLDLQKRVFSQFEGISISVDSEQCIGCGVCAAKCYAQAITIKNGIATMGENCRVCGRCARFCPKDAIKLKLDNQSAVEDFVRRIEAVVDF